MKFANSDGAAPVAGIQRPKTCVQCPLHEVASYNCVPPRGADNPHIMFIGEAPGKDEDRYGQPFIGRSGKLLDELIVKAAINPNVCRWTNSVRCIPKVNGEVKKPTPDQTKVCVGTHLLLEIAQQKPHMIVALGKTASVALTGNRSAIDRMRGYRHPFRFPNWFIQWAETQGMVLYEGIPEKTGGVPPQAFDPKTCRSIEYPVVVTFHPAASLHKKNQHIAGSIESDLVYARKSVYNEPRLEGTDYRVVQTVDELNQWSDYLVDYYRAGHTPWLSLDVETGGKDDEAGLREFDPETEIVSIQVTWKDKHSILIPVSHPEGNFADAFGIAAIRAFLQRLFVEENIPAIGTNLPFDYKQIYAKFGVRLARIAFDAKFAHQCLFAGDQPNDLDYLSAKYCGMQGYGDGLRENMAKLPKGRKSFQNLPLDQAFVDYSCGDTDAVYRMAPTIIDELKQQDLWHTYNHCFLEPLIPMAEMEINGLPVDDDVYQWLRYDMPNHLEKVMEPIRRSSFYPYFLQRRGCPIEYVPMLIDGTAPKRMQKDYGFNPGSSKQKIELLFDVMGLPKNPDRVSEKTGDPSTDKQAMGEIHDTCAANGWLEHLEVVKAIQEYAIVSKLHSAYIVNLPKVVPDKGEPRHELFAHYWPESLLPWSCHPRFKLDGTQTGRLSAADPAIHNMPGKSAVKRLFRSRWRQWGGCHLQFDYGAMEVRILACSFMANDPTLKTAFAQGFDAHKYVASIIFNKPIEDVTPDERKVCKTVNFACVPMDSTALTREGWKTYEEISVGDEVLGYDKGVLKWTPVREKVKYDSAPLVRMENSYFSSVSTPNHRWIGKKRVGRNGRRVHEEGFFTTEGVTSECSLYLSAPVEDEGRLNLSPVEAAIIAFAYGDGSIEKSEYTGSSSQSFGDKLGFRVTLFQSKPDGVKYVDQLISTWGKPVYRRVRPTGIVEWQLLSEDARDLWQRAGLWESENLEQFVISLGSDCRSAFLDSVFMAEGHYHEGGARCYTQNAGAFAESIRLAVYMSGKFPSNHLKKNYYGSDSQGLEIRECKPYVTGQRLESTKLISEQPVWCIKTDLETWVMRQGDQIMLTGNTLYGSGPDNVAGLLGVTKARAEKFIADYLGALPHVGAWKSKMEKFALVNGYVKSAFGRIRYLSKQVYSRGDIERRAVNTPIQSTASDVTLTSYVRIHRRMRELGYHSLPYLFVHDSLGFDVYPGEYFDLWELLNYEMAEVPPQLYEWLDVPLAVDSDSGYSWGAMANVQRFDRNNWKVIGKEANCAALVHQLRVAGHQISYQVTEEVADGKPASAWYLQVSR